MGGMKSIIADWDLLELLREELEEYCDSCGDLWDYDYANGLWVCGNCDNTSKDFEKKTGVVPKSWDELVEGGFMDMDKEIKVLEAKKAKIFGDSNIDEVSFHRCPKCHSAMEECGMGKMTCYVCTCCEKTAQDEAMDRELERAEKSIFE